MKAQPYVLQLKESDGNWSVIAPYEDRDSAVRAGREYLHAWNDGRVARVVRRVVTEEVVWGGVGRAE